MDRDALEAHIKEALEIINRLPESAREPLLAMIEETRMRHVAIEEHSRRSFDALDDWRVMMKYTIFDAEATLREHLGRPN